MVIAKTTAEFEKLLANMEETFGSYPIHGLAQLNPDEMYLRPIEKMNVSQHY